MAYVEDSDYETISVTCDLCQAGLRLSRRDDLGDFEAISGRNFKCSACHGDFWITGDTINTVYEMFIFAADAHFASKHYMLAITSLAQAWELFLESFAYSNFIYRPFWQEARHVAGLEQLNRCSRRLDHGIRGFAYQKLANLVAHTFIRKLHPLTLADAERMIETVVSDKSFRNAPTASELSAIDDSEIRTAVERIRALRTTGLRNKVIHKDAYRPSADEVIACKEEEVVFLFYVRDLFGVGDFDEFAAGVVETPRWLTLNQLSG
jgi:hypothetical protein